MNRRNATVVGRDGYAVEPPHHLEAEESVLGAMMLAANAIDAASEETAPEDFYRGSHAVVFAAVVALHTEGKPGDPVSVVAELEKRGELAEAGGRDRVFELAALVPASANAGHWARLVREYAIRRALISGGTLIARRAQEGMGDVQELLEASQEVVFDLVTRRTRSDMDLLAPAAQDAYQRLVEVHQEGRDIIGLPTGFSDLDRMTSGLQPGQLVVVAGRPSMGKSAFALGILEHVALHEGLPAALFTLEMSRPEVTQRLIAINGLVDLHRLRTGKLNLEDWGNATNAVSRIVDAPLYVDDNAASTVLEIRARARRLKLRQPNLALIAIDYLQLIGGDGRAERRDLEVAQITRTLKVLANELEVPVIAVSQLSRQPEQRHDKRPMLSDLRESGAIEQDADIVIFTYREEYYNPDDIEVAGKAEIIVAKQRHGPTDTVELTFVRKKARFSNAHVNG